MRRASLLLVCVIPLVLVSGCDSRRPHPAYAPKASDKSEFVARAPDGTISPVFATESDAKKYIESSGDQFPSGTVIYKR
jgi:hypothetical protein